MKPVIYVTTESAPSKVSDSLRQKGLGGTLPHPLGLVDAFHETVGLQSAARPDTVNASSEDLTSLGVAISKLRERMGENVLLVFDSLTTPYLMSGSEILRFMRMTLLRLAAEGDAVLACVDEGCGKEEDLVAMMSLANGVIKMETEEGSRILNVVKHPRIEPTEIEVPVTAAPRVISYHYNEEYMRREAEMGVLGVKVTLRPGVGDFVNIAWRNLIFWSGMLWDPKQFPKMMYELTKYSEDPSNYGIDFYSFFPWHKRLLLKLFMPKSFSKVKDMKKII
jgi:KaiC/GvpD/RAD55 family RecA-like ATPase